MKILVACEESQAVTIEFRNAGHEAFSCDLLPCSGGHPEWHLQQDVTPLLSEYWDMVIGFPVCTYLTISANKWYKDQPARKSGVLVGAERRAAREEAIKFFMKIYNANSPRVAVENPIGVMSSVFRKPNQVLQPWMFGHGETKATCLWLRGLPNLIPTNIVEGRKQRIHELPPSKDRSILRSKTFPGIAKAMPSQWGSLIQN